MIRRSLNWEELTKSNRPELTGIANPIKAGGLRMTQTQKNFITAAIQFTTRPLAAFALTPG